MKAIDFLTPKDIIALEQEGHAIHIYPRRHEVAIDGYKKYKINAGTLARYQYFKKHGFLVKS